MTHFDRWRRLFAVLGLIGALALSALVPSPAAFAQTSAEDPAIWIDFKKVQRAQPALLEQQFARLSQNKTPGDIYVLGVAAWSGQDVFIKELDGGIAALTKV